MIACMVPRAPLQSCSIPATKKKQITEVRSRNSFFDFHNTLALLLPFSIMGGIVLGNAVYDAATKEPTPQVQSLSEYEISATQGYYKSLETQLFGGENQIGLADTNNDGIISTKEYFDARTRMGLKDLTYSLRPTMTQLEDAINSYKPK